MCVLTSFTQHCTKASRWWNKARKRNKNDLDLKGRHKTAFLAADISSMWTLNRIFKKATGTKTLYLPCLQLSNQHIRINFVSISLLHIIGNCN